MKKKRNKSASYIYYISCLEHMIPRKEAYHFIFRIMLFFHQFVKISSQHTKKKSNF